MIGSACFVFSLLFIAVCLVEGGCFEGSVFFLVKGGVGVRMYVFRQERKVDFRIFVHVF